VRSSRREEEEGKKNTHELFICLVEGKKDVGDERVRKKKPGPASSRMLDVWEKGRGTPVLAMGKRSDEGTGAASKGRGGIMPFWGGQAFLAKESGRGGRKEKAFNRPLFRKAALLLQSRLLKKEREEKKK